MHMKDKYIKDHWKDLLMERYIESIHVSKIKGKEK